MRWSNTIIPTLKEIPAEAEIASHQLMLRAGLMRKLASGLYTYLPLGWRFIRKVEQIVREEMDRAGALELVMPQLHPIELWDQSGRSKIMGKEMMRLNDRNERQFVLGPTHEEIITSLVANEIRSYKQLPKNFYQIATKFRDEIRPRFGVMRAREFIMKDAYSFDATDEAANKSYKAMYDAYSRIFKRCGLDTLPVEADTGAIGGNSSHEFMVPAEVGEDQMVGCPGCRYSANLEKAECVAGDWTGKELADDLMPIAVETPGQKTIDDVSKFLGILPSELVKTLIYEADGVPVAVLLRGDHDVNEIKLKKVLGCEELALATPDVIQKVTGAPVGFAGPVGLKDVRIVADLAVTRVRSCAVGGNQQDVHLTQVKPGRDFILSETADLRVAKDGDSCPRCGQIVNLSWGIEVGHCFKLGTKYSEAFSAKYLDENGKEQIIIMGCYGIGVTRTAAAVIECHHDADGIIFPWSVAPYQIVLLNLNPKVQDMSQYAENLYQELMDNGFEVIYDERDERPGVKFKDADLLGFPIRITVGERNFKQGQVEIVVRSDKRSLTIPLTDLLDTVKNLRQELLDVLN